MLLFSHLSLRLSRHFQGGFRSELTKEKIAEILSSISEQASFEEIQGWLANDFIPCVIRTQPESLVECQISGLFESFRWNPHFKKRTNLEDSEVPNVRQ